MSFYRRTFLALLFASSLLLVLAVVGAYQVLKGTITENYRVRYDSLATTLAETIQKLESGTEDTMRGALQALRYYTADHPIPSDESLRVMQRNLRVSSIEFVKADGSFIRSTKYDIGSLPKLFEFCAGYRELFTGESEYDHTPLMPSIVDRHVFKFALLPTVDRRHVINIGMEVGYIGELLRTIMQSDRNLMRLALYTPSGKAVGSFSRSQANIIEDTYTNDAEAVSPPLTLAEPNSIELVTPVRATVQNCCECVGKGLVTDPNGTFQYTLKTKVSLGDLNQSIGRIATMLIVAGLVGLLVAFFVSRILARRLTARLDRINRKSLEIAVDEGLTGRFDLKGKDEISNIGRAMDKLLDSLQAKQEELLRSERAKVTAQVARDVAHNIRSPLLAAEGVVQDLQSAPEEQRRRLAGALREIRILVDDLKTQPNSENLPSDSKPRPKPRTKNEEKIAPHHLYSVIECVIDRKQVEYKNRPEICIQFGRSPGDVALFGLVQSHELQVALSNIITNAAEALPDNGGTITIRCIETKDRVRISIRDNGQGISPDILPKLGVRGNTFGKLHGEGLGLAHAREATERWGGSLLIHSEIGKGTEITLEICKGTPPDWFVDQISIPAQGPIVIMDDDPTMHLVWERRVKDLSTGATERIIHMSTGNELSNWVRRTGPVAANAFYLLDYELRGESATGLDLIENLNLTDRSILVTGRYDEASVVTRVQWLGAKMLPKPLVGIIPICLVDSHAPGLRSKNSERADGALPISEHAEEIKS